MKRLLLSATLLALAPLAPAQNELPRPPVNRVPVHGQGCVAAGIQANCLVLHDLKTGRLYNLLVKDIAPPVGLGIEFTGEEHTGPSSCMQGIPVDVTSWARKVSIKCPRRSQRKQ